MGLFYQSPEATDLFRKVHEYGDELRNKHLSGMPPSEDEIAKFDSMRQAVVDNPLCKGYLEARDEIDRLLSTVNSYLCLAIDKGRAPSDEEVAELMNQQVSSCSCGGQCGGNCDSCDGSCHEEGHECGCGKHHS